MRLVARRELTERVRERSFLVGTCVSIAIIALVVVLPPLLGFGETTTYVVATTDRDAAAVVRTAEGGAGAFDVELRARPMSAGEAATALRQGDVDAVLGGGRLRGKEELDDELVGVLQASAQLQEAGASGGPPLRVSTLEPVTRGRDGSVLVALRDGATPQDVLDAARRAGAVTHFSLERPTLTDLFRKAVAA